MKSWKLVTIPMLLVILAVGAALAINWCEDSQVAPGSAPLEVRLQGVADWAKAEQGLKLLGEYTFVTAPEIDETQIKKLYAYQLSDGFVYGYFTYHAEDDEAAFAYAKTVLEAEAQHLGKELYFSRYFFAISDDPETLMGYYTRCSEGWYYRQ